MDRLLIADDEADIVTMLTSFFEGKGYDVMTASDGIETLKQVEKRPDLILLDISMPGLNGLEVCRRIRDHIDCPILFLTAKIEDMDKVKGFSVGGDDYIVKPFSMDVLICRINSLLDSREKLKKLSGKKFSPEAMGIESVSGDDRFTQSFFEIIEKNISNPELGVDLLSQE